jgi:uncharacterized membrane protein YcaP (DUF421 family)
LLLGFAVVLVLPVAAFLGLLGGEAFERVPRVAAVFAVLLLVFRVIGKRELSRLSPFELVTLMLVPECVSNVLQSEGALLDALTGLSTLFLLVLATSVLAHRFHVVERVVEPQSTLLVDHGRILEDALNQERIVPDELYAEMRKQGIANVSDVRWAVLESGGNITFVPKPQGNAGDDDPLPT